MWNVFSITRLHYVNVPSSVEYLNCCCSTTTSFFILAKLRVQILSTPFKTHMWNTGRIEMSINLLFGHVFRVIDEKGDDNVVKRRRNRMVQGLSIHSPFRENIKISKAKLPTKKAQPPKRLESPPYNDVYIFH